MYEFMVLFSADDAMIVEAHDEEAALWLAQMAGHGGDLVAIQMGRVSA